MGLYEKISRLSLTARSVAGKTFPRVHRNETPVHTWNFAWQVRRFKSFSELIRRGGVPSEAAALILYWFG